MAHTSAGGGASAFVSVRGETFAQEAHEFTLGLGQGAVAGVDDEKTALKRGLDDRVGGEFARLKLRPHRRSRQDRTDRLPREKGDKHRQGVDLMKWNQLDALRPAGGVEQLAKAREGRGEHQG